MAQGLTPPRTRSTPALASGDAASWTEVVVALRRFAHESGARFLSDDEFNADMDALGVMSREVVPTFVGEPA
jgi:hypothetical protein